MAFNIIYGDNPERKGYRGVIEHGEWKVAFDIVRNFPGSFYLYSNILSLP